MFYYVRAPFGHVTFKCGENYEVIFLAFLKTQLHFPEKEFLLSHTFTCVFYFMLTS
jgi:hypothetical protein